MSSLKNLLLPCLTIFSLFTSPLCVATLGLKTKGIFIFGASMEDNGNNNFLTNAILTANYPPYGIDFPLGPTGRFSNGRTVTDILAEKLMIPDFIPPFNDPSTRGSRILNGVCYASSGSGILNNTGFPIVGNTTSLYQQIENFEKITLPDLRSLLGARTNEALSKYLFVIAIGENDYIINYFMSNPNNLSVEGFTSNLIATLTNQLKKLYMLGARKFVLLGIDPNGCAPSIRATQPGGACREVLNQAAILFNGRLRNLVDNIRPQIPGSNLVVVDSYKIISDILQSPLTRGFRNTNSPCCQLAPPVGVVANLCARGGNTCSNRNEYVYFDGASPTEAVNVVVANKAFTSLLKSEVYPHNVLSLSLM